MNRARLLKIALLAVAVLILLSPGIAYVAGLQRIEGRPDAADPSAVPTAEVQAAWARCGEQLPLSVQPLNPWKVAVRFMVADESAVGSGETAAHQIAATYNSSH